MRWTDKLLPKKCTQIFAGDEIIKSVTLLWIKRNTTSTSEFKQIEAHIEQKRMQIVERFIVRRNNNII